MYKVKIRPYSPSQWYSEIGLYDLRHRFYSPDIGRFLQSDPIRFLAGDANLYRYCRNNPLKYRDPFGREAVGSYPFPGWHEYYTAKYINEYYAQYQWVNTYNNVASGYNMTLPVLNSPVTRGIYGAVQVEEAVRDFSRAAEAAAATAPTTAVGQVELDPEEVLMAGAEFAQGTYHLMEGAENLGAALNGNGFNFPSAPILVVPPPPGFEGSLGVTGATGSFGLGTPFGSSITDFFSSLAMFNSAVPFGMGGWPFGDPYGGGTGGTVSWGGGTPEPGVGTLAPDSSTSGSDPGGCPDDPTCKQEQ